jgi:hypothetical protein
MALIKCPKCGQTVLSVATTCPKCQHLLTQNPLQQGGHTNLTQCRHCQKMIPGDSITCEYCGYAVRFRRTLRRITWSVVAGFTVALAAVAAVLIQAENRDRPRAEATSPPPLPDVPPRGTTTRSDTSQPATDTVTDTATRTTVPAGTTRPETTRTRSAAAATTPESLRPPPTAAVRYVTVWGNLRATRDTLSPAIGTIAPGTRVLVGPPRLGWYAVYVDSVFAGYMAGDLLSPEAPGAFPR